MILKAHPSQSETATGQSGPYRVHNAEAIALYTNVTAASGTTPTLDIKIQDSPDGSTWYDVPSFANTQFTTTGSERKAAPNVGEKLGPFIRLVWTLGGTSPDFTFQTDIAVLQYDGDET